MGKQEVLASARSREGETGRVRLEGAMGRGGEEWEGGDGEGVIGRGRWGRGQK